VPPFLSLFVFALAAPGVARSCRSIFEPAVAPLAYALATTVTAGLLAALDATQLKFALLPTPPELARALWVVDAGMRSLVLGAAMLTTPRALERLGTRGEGSAANTGA
jgi:hypothetical protein